MAARKENSQPDLGSLRDNQEVLHLNTSAVHCHSDWEPQFTTVAFEDVCKVFHKVFKQDSNNLSESPPESYSSNFPHK